ncbi:heavy metal-binding domain-containing protein, partial [Mesorhizobium sp. M00.F.Ca.ET.186.01.1.1]
MIVTTTSTVQGREIEAYLDIVSGEVIMGANV